MPIEQRRDEENQPADREVTLRSGGLESCPCFALKTCLGRQRSFGASS
jgi:hypothetical protein